MGRTVNRHDPDYHTSALGWKTDNDLTASFLLALSYSGRTRQTPKSQRLIQMDCVAVCFVGNDLWVASNSQKISSFDILELRKVLCDPDIDIYIVRNGSGKMHAEMQLLKELIECSRSKLFDTLDMVKFKISANNYEFGVSKPCCRQCAQKMGEYKIACSAEHGDYVVHWESPD